MRCVSFSSAKKCDCTNLVYGSSLLSRLFCIRFLTDVCCFANRDKYGFKIEQKFVEDIHAYLNTYYAGRLALQKESWRNFFAQRDLQAAIESQRD